MTAYRKFLENLALQLTSAIATLHPYKEALYLSALG